MINPTSRGGNLDETGNSDTQVPLDPFFIIVSRQLRSLFSKQSIADELCPLEKGDGEESTRPQESGDRRSSPTSTKSPHDLERAPPPLCLYG